MDLIRWIERIKDGDFDDVYPNIPLGWWWRFSWGISLSLGEALGIVISDSKINIIFRVFQGPAISRCHTESRRVWDGEVAQLVRGLALKIV